MKKTFIFTMLCFMSAMLFAQTNYKAGYVVNLKGDTLRGFINFKEWRNSPTSIDFKTEPKSGFAQSYSVANIKCFIIDGYEQYFAYTVKISLSHTDVLDATVGIDTSYKTDTVFLRVLYKGRKATLFEFQDDLKKRFYFLDNTVAVPEELIYSVYHDPENTSEVLKNNYYYSQLNLLAMRNQKDLTKLVGANLNYEEGDLIKVFAMIDGENKHQTEAILKSHTRYRKLLGVAANLNTFQYTGASPFPDNTATTFVSPTLSVGFDDFLNPNVGRSLFRVEIALSVTNFTATDQGNNYSTNYVISQKISQITSSLRVQTLYNFYNADLFKVFGGLGLSLNYSIYPTNKFTGNYNGSTSSQNNYPQMRNLWATTFAKTGVVLSRKTELFIEYNMPFVPITSDYLYFSSRLQTWAIGVNFLFDKAKK